MLPEKLKYVYHDYNNGQFSVRRWIALAELMEKEVDTDIAVKSIFPDQANDILDALAVAE